MNFFRRRNRCLNLSPSPHPSYYRRQCELQRDHDGVCKISIGRFKHYWRNEFYESRGMALRKEESGPKQRRPADEFPHGEPTRER